MRKFILFQCAFLFLSGHRADAGGFDFMPPAWREIEPSWKLPKWTVEPKKKSNWSGFWSSFKFKDTYFPKLQFEMGILAYRTANSSNRAYYKEYWRLNRMETFMRIQFAVLNKYIQPYILVALSTKTNFRQRLYDIRPYSDSAPFELKLELESNLKPILGGGLRFFFLGWKKINFYGYGHMQTTTQERIVFKRAELILAGRSIDATELIKDSIEVFYEMIRFEAGITLTYQMSPGFMPYLNIGYIYVDAFARFQLSPVFSQYVKALTSSDPSDIIPSKVPFGGEAPVGLLGMKIRIYKKFYLNLEGTIAPINPPIFFGQISLIIEGDK